MKKQPISRFSPLSINPNLTITNRVVIPPMASETADQHGYVTEKTIAHYKSLGESGAGLILVEYTFIHASGKSESNQLGIDHNDKILGLTEISKVIKSSGALAGIQLTHCGGKTESQLTGGVLHSPSGVIVPVKDKILEKPSIMTDEDIRNWKKWFLDSATRAVKAGFDLIELHAAHGYGLNQWLSPITNKRDDHYGGSTIKNLTLLLEIIQEIKAHHPNLIISVRMPGQDFIEGGLTIQDCILIAQSLENSGINLINISSGIGGWKRPRTRIGEGYLVEEAATIQQFLKIPVIGVGGIETGNYIDELIRTNKISLAAVGRAILQNPREWGENQLRSTHHV